MRYSGGNSINNNFFNNTRNFGIDSSVNRWNITKTSRINIAGGPYFGGNFWDNLSGSGFSRNCKDTDLDGICDTSYNLTSDNIDFLPLVIRNIIPFPCEVCKTPTDPDGDGLYEDINGNGGIDFNDVVMLFNYLEWVESNQPITNFDFNGNGRIDFNDIIKLFEKL